MLPLDMAVPASVHVIENATTFGELVHGIELFSKEIANKIISESESEISFNGLTYTKDAETYLDSESKKAITQFVATLSQFHDQEQDIVPKSSKKDLTYKKTPTSEQDTNPKPSEEVLTYKKTPTSDPIAVPTKLLNTQLPESEYITIADFLRHTSFTHKTLAKQLRLRAGDVTDILEKNQLHGEQIGFLTCLQKYRERNPFSLKLKFFLEIIGSQYHVNLVKMAETANKKTEQENSRKADLEREKMQVAKAQAKKEAVDRGLVFGTTASSSTTSNTSKTVKSENVKSENVKSENVKSENESKLSKLGSGDTDKKRQFLERLAEHSISLDKLESKTLKEIPTSAFSKIAEEVSVQLLLFFFDFTTAQKDRISYLHDLSGHKIGTRKALEEISKTMNLLDFCIKMTNAAGIDCFYAIIDELVSHKII